MQVANTILNQIGGRKFIAMTGARDFVGSEDGLQFKLPRGFAANGISHVRIRLDPSDTYTMQFLKWKPRKLEMETIAEQSGLYFDNLQPEFTRQTGLDTHL